MALLTADFTTKYRAIRRIMAVTRSKPRRSMGQPLCSLSSRWLLFSAARTTAHRGTEITTAMMALMPEVAVSVFACTEREFRRSMSDFKPGEIITSIQLPADDLRTSAALR